MKTKNIGESVEKHLKTKIKNPRFRRLYEHEFNKVKLGWMLCELRTHARLTQAQLAHKVGVTQGYIARLENAETANYEIDTLKKIAAALHKVVVIGFAEEPKAHKSLEVRELVAC
jgi:transcriptional regulator with XRE-family HTH domain